MKPILYYLCGYQSTSRISPKFAHFQRTLSADFEVLPLDYPGTYEPERCRDFFQSQIQVGQPLCFMGSSLGGFWANRLANQFAAPCVLLNPCCRPSALADRFSQSRVHFADFATMENAALNPTLPRLVFLAQDDQVLDYRVTTDYLPTTAEQVIFATGGHTLWRRLPEIDKHITAFFSHHQLFSFANKD